MFIFLFSHTFTLQVLQALGLGARAVFIGRPALWGLAYNGHAGVEHVLSILSKELRADMMCVGCKNIEDIDMDVFYEHPPSQRTPKSSML